jgi:rhodanese-related sulfurtransferase
MTDAKPSWKSILVMVGVVVGVGCSVAEDSVDRSATPDEALHPVPGALSDETTSQSMKPRDLMARLESVEGPVVLDVRSPEEYVEGHIPGAVNVPYDQIGARLDSLDAYRDRGFVIYCRTGRRAGIAETVLIEAGFERVWDLEGHMVAWKEQDLPLSVTMADCC